jgi:hypothetical protein
MHITGNDKHAFAMQQVESVAVEEAECTMSPQCPCTAPLPRTSGAM